MTDDRLYTLRSGFDVVQSHVCRAGWQGTFDLSCFFFFVLVFFSNPSQNQSIRQIQSPLERRINIQTWSQAIVEQISYLLISVSQKRQAVTLFLCASSAVMCVCVCADYPKWVWMWLKWCNLFFKPNVIFLADNEAAVDCHTALSHMRVIAVTHTRTHAYPASFHRQTHKHARVKITANRSSDYVSVTLNTAWILCTRHITTHTHTIFLSSMAVFIWVCVLMGNVTAAQTNWAAQNRQLCLSGGGGEWECSLMNISGSSLFPTLTNRYAHTHKPCRSS